MSEFSTSEESAYERTRLWGDAIEMFKSSPILGIGKGQFIHNEENTRGLMAHSNFMQNLAEVGALGTFIWIALIYFSFVGLWRIYQIKALPGTQECRLASLSRSLLISFVGFNICTLFITMEIDLFYLLLGLCAAAVNIAHREIKPISIKFSLKDVMIIFGIIIGLLAFYKIYVK
jgi:O-antigen ligase